MEFKAISVNDIEKIILENNAILIDLRSEEEYNMYHIENARNIPFEHLEEKKNHLTTKQTYILYCERGGSSLQAARELSAEGFKVYTVVGGIDALIELQ